LLIATVIVIAVFGGCLWLFGFSLAAQFGNITERLRGGERHLQILLSKNGLDPTLVTKSASRFSASILDYLNDAVEWAEVAVIITIMSIYLAAEPGSYQAGVRRLFPPATKARAMEALKFIGASLRLWMLGQLLLMLLVGVLSFIALSAIGIPNAGALALIAGATEAVPYLGPFIGAVPAVLVALSLGLHKAILTTLLYLLLHLIEGYLVGPILQRWFVRIPPALILGGIFASQLLFGFAGVILAAPIAVAVFAAVKVLYIHDILHQPVQPPEQLST
jgi:predicted PurR-regulated permease PerM